MTLGTLILYLLVFLVAIALVIVVAKALRSWVFELTPTQWMSSFLLSFASGALLVAILDGNGEVELLAALPIGIAVTWVIAAAALGGRGSGRSSRNASAEE